MKQIWDDLLTDEDRMVLEKAGYADRGAASWGSRELGTRPALGVIDMQAHLVGPDVPILDAIETYPTAIGEAAWRALVSIRQVLRASRSANLPIFFTRIIPRGSDPDEKFLQIVPQMDPGVEESVFDKRHSSAFFGTPLSSFLKISRVDTLILVGNSTSGCVRATAVDARAFGFDVLIPQECTFDRIEASHKVSLLDLWMKYARVDTTEETVKYISLVARTSESEAPVGGVDNVPGD